MSLWESEQIKGYFFVTIPGHSIEISEFAFLNVAIGSFIAARDSIDRIKHFKQNVKFLFEVVERIGLFTKISLRNSFIFVSHKRGL